MEGPASTFSAGATPPPPTGMSTVFCASASTGTSPAPASCTARRSISCRRAARLREREGGAEERARSVAVSVGVCRRSLGERSGRLKVLCQNVAKSGPTKATRGSDPRAWITTRRRFKECLERRPLPNPRALTSPRVRWPVRSKYVWHQTTESASQAKDDPMKRRAPRAPLRAPRTSA